MRENFWDLRLRLKVVSFSTRSNSFKKNSDNWFYQNYMSSLKTLLWKDIKKYEDIEVIF